MEQRAQYSNGCHLSKNSNRYTTLFDLDSIKNVHIRGTDNDDDVTSTSQSDSQESKGCGILMEHTNENRAGKFSELRSELPLKRKRRDIDAETSYNTSFQRDDESIEEDGNYENHISEEHYRNMLGEHVQRYKKSRLKEESRVASTRMGTPNIKHNFNLKSRKPSHEYQNTVNEGKTAFGTEPSSPDILSVYNGSHRGASHSHYDHNSIQGQQMLASSLLEIYDGITYRIPPVYDKLAPLLNMPTFADICIEEQLLMGRLDSRSLSRIMASEKYPKCCNRTGMGESFTEFNSLQERLKSGQNFKLQVFEADLSPMQQDALGTKRLIMSETGTLQYCYVKILEKGDSYEIIERKLPRKQPMKKDPSTIEKEDTEKVGKCWANIVKRDIPKHVKTFFLHAKKQANDAKKLSDNCQKEVKARTARSLKMAKGAAGRTRKLTRDMLMFWKRVDKEQAEIRKKEEREAAEAQKREEELREAKRHQQRLNFLISQTELYSHFMQNKSSQVIDSSTRAAGASVDEAETGQNLNATRAAEEDDPEEIAYKEEAIRVARNAVSEQKRKTSAFDNECLKFRRANSVSGEGIPDGSNNIDLLNPSSMPLTSSVQQPKLFRGTLKEYQLKGLQWLVNCYEQGLNGILADEMGLGKTIQAVAFLAHLAEEKNIWGPFLVVAPSSVLNNWADEFSKFCPDLKALPYWGPSVERSVLRKSIHRKYLYRRDASFHVVITSYQLVITDEKYFKRVGWQYMVLDEAQAIKSSMSIRWKTLLGFNCRNRLLLTGTPIQNNMAELWALLHFIMPTLFDSHEQFNEWFSKGIENHAEHGGTLNEHQLNRLHAILKPFMLRRVKKDVITEMTSKREVTVDCMLSSRQQAFYRAIKNKISVAELMTSARGHLNEKKVANLMNIVIQLRKVCNHPELFERNEGRTFMYFGKRSYPLLPAPFGEMEEIHYAGNRNPISYRIPKLVYRESCLEQPISSKSDLEFSKKFLHHRLNIFSPDNIYQSIFAPNGETETNFTVRSGTFGFSRMIDLSPTELAFLANGHLLERVLFSVAKWDKLFLDSIIEESSKTDGMYYNDSIEESKTRAITRLLMLPTRSEWSTLRRKHATGPYQMPFEELAMSHDDRFLRNIKLLKSVYSFIPPTHAPPIDVTCSDRGFAYQQAETFHHPWLKRLLVGFARTSEFNGPARPQEPPPLIQEIDSHLHAQRPLLKLTNRIFGSSPPLQSFDLAKMLMDSGKLQTLDALLKRLRAENHRVLLFAQMTKMLNILEDYMNYRKYKYRRLDGSSTIAERRDTVKDFQDRQDIFVFLLSTRAGGVGINLTAADTVIFYESDWNPTLDLQAMDRAHRLGQTKEVMINF